MNKYKEALDNIEYYLCELEGIKTQVGNVHCIYDENLEVLKELVDKATPKKPDYEGDGYDDNGQMIYDTWICPNCGKRYEVDYDDYDYCPNCGQALDWSEEDDG